MAGDCVRIGVQRTVNVPDERPFVVRAGEGGRKAAFKCDHKTRVASSGFVEVDSPIDALCGLLLIEMMLFAAVAVRQS